LPLCCSSLEPDPELLSSRTRARHRPALLSASLPTSPHELRQPPRSPTAPRRRSSTSSVPRGSHPPLAPAPPCGRVVADHLSAAARPPCSASLPRATVLVPELVAPLLVPSPMLASPSATSRPRPRCHRPRLLSRTARPCSSPSSPSPIPAAATRVSWPRAPPRRLLHDLCIARPPGPSSLRPCLAFEHALVLCASRFLL
jgi:hypothetical protein